MTTTPTPRFFVTLIEALAHYGDRELCFQHRHDGTYALANNADGALIDALTACGAWLIDRTTRELQLEQERQEWHEEQERLERFRYLDGEHERERYEYLPETYHPDTL